MITISVCLVTLCVCAKSFQLCLTLCNSMAVALQAPLSMEFSKEEYWRGLPFPPPEDHPDPRLLSLLHWQVGSLPLTPPGKHPPLHRCPIHPYKYRHYNSIYIFSVWYHIILMLPMKCPLSLSVFWHLNLASVRCNNPPCGLLDSYHRFSEAAFLCLLSVFSCHMLPWAAASPLATICCLTGVLLSIGFLPVY